jgi:hypothetical protein
VQETVINQKRERLLFPLLEWGILGAHELAELSDYQGSERGLRKMLERAEKSGAVCSFFHNMGKRKFVYLTRRAHEFLTPARWGINETIKMHDAILTSTLYRFSKFDFVSEAKINYQSIEINQTVYSNGIDHDGMFRAKRNNNFESFALEIELTRKNSTEIMKKFQKYDESNAVDWAIYFFNSRNVLDAYNRYYEDYRKLPGVLESKCKFIFCYSSDMAHINFNPLNSIWIKPNNAESTLRSFFSE